MESYSGPFLLLLPSVTRGQHLFWIVLEMLTPKQSEWWQPFLSSLLPTFILPTHSLNHVRNIDRDYSETGSLQCNTCWPSVLICYFMVKVFLHMHTGELVHWQKVFLFALQQPFKHRIYSDPSLGSCLDHQMILSASRRAPLHPYLLEYPIILVLSL